MKTLLLEGCVLHDTRLDKTPGERGGQYNRLSRIFKSCNQADKQFSFIYFTIQKYVKRIHTIHDRLCPISKYVCCYYINTYIFEGWSLLYRSLDTNDT